MASIEVFNNIDLKEYIFSFIYSFDYILKNDRLDIIINHKNRLQNFLIDENLDLACKYGSIKIVNWFYKELNIYGTELSMDYAVKSKNIDLINYLVLNSREGCSPYCLLMAVETNIFEIVEFICLKFGNLFLPNIFEKSICYAISNNNEIIASYLYKLYREKFNKPIICLSQDCILCACSNNNLNILKWTLEKSNNIDIQELNIAAKNSNLSILNFLYNNRNYENTIIHLENSLYMAISSIKKTLYYSVLSNDIRTVKFVLEKDGKKYKKNIIKDSFSYTCLIGNQQILELLIKTYNPSTNFITKCCLPNAILSKNFDLLNFIYNKYHYNKIIYTSHSFNNAYQLSNMKMVDWLIMHNYKGFDNQKIINNNVKFWNYDFFKFFYNEIYLSFKDNFKFIFNSEFFSFACKSCNEKIIYFLDNLGIRPDRYGLINSCINGNLSIIKLINEKYNNYGIINEDLLNYLLRNGKLKILKYFFENNQLNFDINESINIASQNDNMLTIYWLFDIGIKNFSSIALNNFIENSNYIGFNYLFKKNKKLINQLLVNKIIKNGEISMLKLVLQDNKNLKYINNNSLLLAFEQYNFTIIAYLQEYLT